MAKYPMSAPDLARELKADPKALRRWLRNQFPRLTKAKGTDWAITAAQAKAARAQFKGKGKAAVKATPKPKRKQRTSKPKPVATPTPTPAITVEA